jgi:hypothetical protein
VTTDNPKGVVYKAVFPDEAFFKGAYPDGGNLKGWVTAKSSEDGVGVSFKFDISGLPDSGGPFSTLTHPILPATCTRENHRSTNTVPNNRLPHPCPSRPR